jgi:hypothetical protein
VTRRSTQLSLGAAAFLVALGLLASLATVGVAQSGPAAADQYGDKKVTICHHAKGKKGTKHVTIRISRNALPAHLRHGDTVGACGTRANRAKHATKAHAKKFHQKAKKGKGRKG